MKSWIRHGWICLALAGLTLVGMGRVVNNDFVNIDDPMYVTANAHVIQGVTADSLRWAWTTRDAAFWIPLTWMSLQLDATLYWPDAFGPPAASAAAWGFHLTNLLIHIVNTLLVYWLIWRLTESAGVATCVAALFGIHPLHVESVAWITERKDVLSGFFGLLALLNYATYQEKPSVLRMFAIALLFALSLMAKPVLVVLPAIMLLLDWWRRRRFGQASWMRMVVEKLPLFSLSLLFTAITVGSHSQVNGVADLKMLTIGTRCANALVSYQSYLTKAFWPTELAVFYPHPAIYWQPDEPLSIMYVVQAAVLLSLITAIAVALRNSIPAILVGWFWFLGALLPNIGIVQAGNQGMADRFSYFALLGLSLAVVAASAYLARRIRLHAMVVGAAAILVIAAYGVLTFVQIGYWKDSTTLYLRTLEVTQNNGYIHGLLGIHLSENHDLDRAEWHLAQSMAIRLSSYPEFHYVYGHVLLEQGRKSGRLDPDSIERARSHLQHAIKLKPNYLLAYYELAVLEIGVGEIAQARETIESGLAAADNPVLEANLRKLLEHCQAKPRPSANR